MTPWCAITSSNGYLPKLVLVKAVTCRSGAPTQGVFIMKRGDRVWSQKKGGENPKDVGAGGSAAALSEKYGALEQFM